MPNSWVLYLLVLSVTLASSGHAIAQNEGGIDITTNKASYHPGDKVLITGTVPQISEGIPVTIIVRNPIGNVYEVGQVPLMKNTFVHSFILKEDSQGGVYTIDVKYGSSTGQLQFMVSIGQLQTISVFDKTIKVIGANTNLIKYGDASVSTVDYSISIPVDTSKISSNYIMEEYQIPKDVIDAPGGQLVVKADGKDLSCAQTETNTQRILDCPIESGTRQLMFTGTVIIPEFGQVAPLILAGGILVIVTIFTGPKLFGKLRISR